MNSSLIRIIVAGVSYLVAATSGVVIENYGSRCGGVQRWEVKVLADDNLKLSRSVKTMTIEELHDIQTPDVGKKWPRQDLERQRVRVRNVKIVEKIKEADEDLHLVLEDDDGRRLIAELPYYDCPDAAGTDFADDYLQARINFLAHSRDFKKYRWTVTGVLFVDLPHGTPQHGVADNNIEIHPVLSIEAIND
jgi:hypothetical protein